MSPYIDSGGEQPGDGDGSGFAASAASAAASHAAPQHTDDGAIIEPTFTFGFASSVPGCAAHLEGSYLLLLAGQHLVTLDQEDRQVGGWAASLGRP